MKRMVQTNDPNIRTKSKTIFFGILAGLIAYMIIGAVGLYLLKVSWAEYSSASKNKSYTFEMKLSRLFIGIIASMFAGIIPTIIANDKGKTTWLVGIIIFCFAAYNHFFRVWADYPVWYHFSYLLPIIPITGLSHRLMRKPK